MQHLNRAPASDPGRLPVHSAVRSRLPGRPSIERYANFENPTASPWSLSRSKRILDFAVALSVLVVFAIPMLIVALCVRLSSAGPALFVQQRVGRGGRLFAIYKFRSMVVAAPSNAGPGLTKDGDCRVTAMGRCMRRFKLDELPQFINVLLGDMSLVGPRPKLPQYAAIVNMPYRPGITGAATLAFRKEEEMLACVHPSHLDLYYHQEIKPLKAAIDVRYMCRATLLSDLRLIAGTFLACVAPSRVPVVLHQASTLGSAFQPQSVEGNPAESFEAAS